MIDIHYNFLGNLFDILKDGAIAYSIRNRSKCWQKYTHILNPIIYAFVSIENKLEGYVVIKHKTIKQY